MLFQAGRTGTGSTKPFRNVSNVHDLCAILAEQCPARHFGNHVSRAVLIKAAPGSGKTWLTMQALHTLARPMEAVHNSRRYLPLLLPVQRLAYLRRTHKTAAGKAAAIWKSRALAQRRNSLMPTEDAVDLLEWYIRIEYRKQQCDLLLDAYRSQRLLLILDGLDEAVELKNDLASFIIEHLIPNGHRCLVTSRPEGTAGTDLEEHGPPLLDLKKLRPDQQRKVLEQQLSGRAGEFVNSVLSFAKASQSMVRRGRVCVGATARLAPHLRLSRPCSRQCTLLRAP